MSELQNPSTETPQYRLSMAGLPIGFLKFAAVCARVEQFWCYLNQED